MNRFWQRHWRLLLVLVAAAIVFGRSVDFPFSMLDDRTFVLHNPLLANPLAQGLLGLLTTPSMGYPHTVTVLSFAVDHRLFGDEPAGYHLVNVLTHLGVVSVLYLLLLRLAVDRRIAAAAVAFFALHPLVTEPVCWVIGRKDLLATGLLLGAMTIAAGGERDARPSRSRLAAVVVATALAMLAKPSTILAPLLLWPFVRAARPAWMRSDALAVVVPTAVAALTIAGLSVFGLKAQGAFVERTRMEMLVDPLRAATLQLNHLFWPRDLLAEYYRVPGDPTVLAMLTTLVAGAAATVYALRRTAPRSIERLAFVLFAIAFLPASGVLPTAHWSADSYFYLPLAFVTLLLATVGPRHWPGLVGLPFLAVALAVLSVSQTRTWSSPSAMFAPVVARYPGEPRPLNRLAFAYGEEGNDGMAARTFIDLENRFPDFAFNRGQRASSFDQMGDHRGADAIYLRCVRERDAECAMRYWVNVLNGKRRPEQSSTELVGAAYELAATQLAQASSPSVLRTVAASLRTKGLELLARRAEADAEAKERATSHVSGF